MTASGAVTITPIALAKRAAQIADDKKADDVVLLDLRKISDSTDFFVICGSEAVIGVKAIAEEILLRLKEEGVTATHVEGLGDGFWTLVDYGDVIVHVFLKQAREYYDLESLWGDAPRKSFRPKPKKRSPKKATRQ